MRRPPLRLRPRLRRPRLHPQLMVSIPCSYRKGQRGFRGLQMCAELQFHVQMVLVVPLKEVFAAVLQLHRCQTGVLAEKPKGVVSVEYHTCAIACPVLR